ncbi:MAG TPA: hypothetical protein ENN51_08940 [candidate division WOR-3 bacterium]|uniref:Aerotolerance regulator N-terminal domain-containing protein n=1 Tax=candidate division WOR-3 bacterium TaxID=2052148 RepID=A0A7V0T7Q2_UNCW3|nr:hypothetical protein [candidate division WOR-3 bacterium]
MLGFGLPALLPLAFLAALPVVIHLVSRARLRRLDFPSLRLLEHLKRERVALSRLKEILLLILRTLALLALLLALARPWLRSGSGAAGPTDLVLLVDDSYSMQYGSTWPRACSLARKLLRTSPPDARTVILTASGPDRPARTLAPGPATVLLDTLRPSWTDARIVEALPRAVRVADSLGARLVLLTDLQHRSLTGNWTVTEGRDVLILNAGAQRPDNLAVTGLELARPVAILDRETAVRIELANHGPDPAVASLELETDGRPLAGTQTTINLPARRSSVLNLDIRFPRPGPTVLSAQLRSASDSLPADNTRHLAVDVRTELRVLLLGSARVPSRYAAAALLADRAGAITLTESPDGRLDRHDLRDYDAVVALDALALTDADWTRLLFGLTGGTGLVLMASPTTAVPAALAGFARSQGILRPSGFLAVTEADSLHPLFTGIDPGLWQTPRITAAARLRPDSARVLARFGDGNPFLLEAAAGRVLLWATGPAPEFTDLVRRAAFVPLLVSSVEHVALGGRVRSAHVGDTLRFPTGSSVGDALLATPDRRMMVEPRRHQGEMVYERTDTRRPGAYRLTAALTDETVALAAVNIRPGESDLERIRPDALPPNVRVADDYDGGRDLTQLLLFLAAGAFAAELLLLLLLF